MVTDVRNGAIGASRKAEVAWDQMFTQIKLITEITKMILE